MIPVSVLLGILLGTIVGFLYVLIMNRIDLPIYVHVILVLGLSFGMIAVENLLKNIISISSLLGIIALAVIIRIFFNEKALSTSLFIICARETINLSSFQHQNHQKHFLVLL